MDSVLQFLFNLIAYAFGLAILIGTIMWGVTLIAMIIRAAKGKDFGKLPWL